MADKEEAELEELEEDMLEGKPKKIKKGEEEKLEELESVLEGKPKVEVRAKSPEPSKIPAKPPKIKPEKVIKIIVCPRCGEESKYSAVFCDKCGNRLKPKRK